MSGMRWLWFATLTACTSTATSNISAQLEVSLDDTTFSLALRMVDLNDPREGPQGLVRISASTTCSSPSTP
jgi:hypothetical protein